MAIKYVQAQPFTLAGAGSSVGDTSLVLSSMKGIDGANLTMTDFGSKGWMTIEPGSAVNEEQISFTGITQNANGTATLTGVSTVLFVSPYTETSGLAKLHAGGVVADVSNTSGFYNTLVNKSNDETITGKYTFPNGGNTPILGSSYVAPTLSNQVASKGYVDSVAFGVGVIGTETTAGYWQGATVAQQGTATDVGSTTAHLVPMNKNLVKTSSGAADENKIPILDASGTLANGFIDKARTWGTVQSFTAANAQITTDASNGNDAVRKSYQDARIPLGLVSGTSGEAITAGQGVYIKASDSKLYKTLGTGDESTYSFVGIAFSTVGAADLTVTYCPPGHTVTGLSSLTAGAYYYITDSAGTLSTTPGTRFAKVAQAISTTVLRVIEPKFIRTGSTTFSSTGTSVQTCGFYPAKITLAADNNQTATTGGSFTTEGGGVYQIKDAFGFATTSGFGTTTLGWRCRDGAASVERAAGNVSARSSTGFTLNATTQTSGTTTILWTAESL